MQYKVIIAQKQTRNMIIYLFYNNKTPITTPKQIYLIETSFKINSGKKKTSVPVQSLCYISKLD